MNFQGLFDAVEAEEIGAYIPSTTVPRLPTLHFDSSLLFPTFDRFVLRQSRVRILMFDLKAANYLAPRLSFFLLCFVPVALDSIYSCVGVRA